MAKNTPGDCKADAVNKSFQEESDLPDIPTEIQVVIAKEVPRMEKIIFHNNRDPGSTLYFHYASKTHPLKHYTLFHGHEHELPVEVIRHLEGQAKNDPYACHTRLYGSRMRADGVSETYVNGYVSCFRCQTIRT